VADQYKVVYDLSISTILNDFKQLLTQISRSRNTWRWLWH